METYVNPEEAAAVLITPQPVVSSSCVVPSYSFPRAARQMDGK
jgi:hypothetical protein